MSMLASANRNLEISKGLVGCTLTESHPRFISDRQQYEVGCQHLKGILHLWDVTLGLLTGWIH